MAQSQRRQARRAPANPASLRRLPSSMKAAHTARMDGIRWSLETTNLAYARTLHVAEEISRRQLDPARGRTGELYPALLLDAWGVIDAVHRLGFLVKELPGKMAKVPRGPIDLITGDIHQVRNLIQHLDEHMDWFAKTDSPVWGTVSWIYMNEELRAESQARSYLVSPGTVRQELSLEGIVMPAAYHLGVQEIALTSIRASSSDNAGQRVRIDLSEAVRQGRQAVEALEASLALMDASRSPGGDMLLTASLTLTPAQPDTASEPALPAPNP